MMRDNTKRICLLAILTGLLSTCKIAVPIPNVEVVTSLFVSFAIVLRLPDVILLSYCFVLLEVFIWGFALWWVLTYLIYWPLLCLSTALITRIRTKKIKNQNCECKLLDNNCNEHCNYYFSVIKGVVVGIIFTIIFGFLSTVIEVSIFRGFNSDFFLYCYIRYVAGIPFFATHIISNAVVLPIIVPIVVRTLQKIKFVKSPSSAPIE